MRRWLKVSALVGAALLCAHLASAQSSDSSSDDDGGVPNYALSLGVGLVEPAGQTENYYTAALRIRLGRGDDSNQPRTIQGYLEPEIGYWESNDDRFAGDDTLVGVNLVGAFPFSAAETFLGVGVGVHFIDRQLLESDARLSGSETKLGVNAQFGIDLNLARHFSVFGASRFDLIQGAKDNVQSKIYLGARMRF